MSAKDANPTGEVGEAKENKSGDIIDSPNITNASADESEPYVDAKEEARKAAQKKAETVEIDGVPIKGKDLVFKARNIKRKDADDYFVNVDRRELEKKERRKARAEEAVRKKEENRSRAKKMRQQTKDFLFKGWHKFAFAGVIVALLVGAYFIWVHPLVLAEIQRKQDEELAAKIAKEEEQAKVFADIDPKINEANQLVASFDVDMALPIYDSLIKENTDPDILVRIYINRSRALFNSNQYSLEYRELEISDAMAAYELDKESLVVVGWLVELHTRAGNTAEAQKYQAIEDELIQKAMEEEKNKGNVDENALG